MLLDAEIFKLFRLKERYSVIFGVTHDDVLWKVKMKKTNILEKKPRKKRENKHYFFRPSDLQERIDSYGYNFSMGKYLLFILTVTAGAVGCGVMFSLRWYFMVLLVLVCLKNLPFLILDGYKQMYEHKRFLDLSDYMEQILYSFRTEQKIVGALKDTQALFGEGQMYEVIGKAVDYIEGGRYQRDLYKEALEMI